ncbi:membrane protein insertase YidC [Chlorobium phaeovibrioides]|uniref:Membrane protein insertase YidC n=1 Tax=Chlorobium phaeovibrioides TaxID=1094 RepID=A0ABW9USP6_CHLPH|nr:membrane protein insertase YidC [Chlorobium phaeovibrioides]MWV54476.1 membrane protein insertase YidC [Chlorobium phaeovibrioides]
MDRNSVTGLALIALIMIVWLQFMSPDKKPVIRESAKKAASVEQVNVPLKPAPVSASDAFGAFASAANGKARKMVVENDLFRATISSKGATLTSLILKKHLDGALQPVQLVSNRADGALSLLFLTREGRKIDTRDLYFTGGSVDTLHTITGKESYSVRYRLNVSKNRNILITYSFTGDSYRVGYDVQLNGFSSALAGNEYQLQWDGGLGYTEKNREDEAHNALAGAYLGGSLVKLDAAKDNQAYREEQSGEAKWVAVRNKYFVAALIPSGPTGGFYLDGSKKAGNEFENYLASLKMEVPVSGASLDDSFSLYMGPLDYDIVRAQKAELEKIMDFGWDWLTRPFAEYIILPVFSWMNKFIHNYGLIIIIFAFLIKLVTYPLSLASTKSMKKMAALQPMLKELQDKYKDNPAKLQSELGRIYKEAGVNPLGGCLPVVLQMPLLFAMFYVFRSSIELRQHGFLWAHDLSVPDSILNLGFTIPMYGDHIALMPILMAGTVFVQQKITPTAQTNDQMKIMLYMFPAMMLLFFNNMPSGLGLYYLMFNVFSVAQQFYINSTTTEADMPNVSIAAPARQKKKKSGSGK